MFGTLVQLPSDNETVGGVELHVDYWQLIGRIRRAGGIESAVNADSEPDVQFNNRHLMIRGENTARVIKMHDVVLRSFRKHFKRRGFREVRQRFIR